MSRGRNKDYVGNKGPIYLADISGEVEAALIDQGKHGRDWLDNPISMSKLQRAVRNRADTIELNGRMFSIEYGRWFRSVVDPDEGHESVRLKRLDGGYVPFGYMAVSKILAFEFEAGDSNE